MMIKALFPPTASGVHYATPPKRDFEDLYLAIRTREQRVPTDDEIRKFPLVPAHHPHAREWRLRRITNRRFLRYLATQQYRTILDIGCGNGWFTAQMATLCPEVTGMDVGKHELETAARCFGNPQLQFVCCTDWQLLPARYFDCITFNASIQYFVFSPDFWNNLLRLLKPGGEIHFLDSPFYSKQELEAAKQRSATYFQQLNAPEAARYYHHHCWEELPRGSEVRYRPVSWKKYLRLPQSPFPWIVLRLPVSLR